jgi:hypothetical protein
VYIGRQPGDESDTKIENRAANSTDTDIGYRVAESVRKHASVEEGVDDGEELGRD